MAIFSRDIGIDLGTSYTRMAESGQVLMSEPTVVTISVNEQMIVEIGQDAQDMIGKVPETLEIARPLQNGVIADYEVTEKLIEYFLKRISGPVRFIRPRLMVTVPYGVTSVESRAVHEASLEAGARDSYLIPQPLAAAIGIDLPINSPTGSMLISLGGGATQVAVIAVNGIVTAQTLRFGGENLDEVIISYIRKKYGLIIGRTTAERIKIEIGAAVPQSQDKSIDLQGQDQVTGLPKPFSLLTGEIVEALQDSLTTIVETSRQVLESTPPELVSDIIDKGIAICGGGSLLTGIDKMITKELGVPAYLVQNATTCTVEGASIALEPAIFSKIKRSLLMT